MTDKLELQYFTRGSSDNRTIDVASMESTLHILKIFKVLESSSVEQQLRKIKSLLSVHVEEPKKKRAYALLFFLLNFYNILSVMIKYIYKIDRLIL